MRGWIPALGVVAAATLLAACGCMLAGHGSGYDECVANEASREESERNARRARKRERDEARRHEEPCRRGDPQACLVVGTWGKRNGVAAATVEAQLAVACGGGLVAGCLEAAPYARARGDTATAIARYRRACELRDPAGCLGAAQLDPASRPELERAACDAGDGGACLRVGEAQLAAGRRADATAWLTRACRLQQPVACQRLGAMDVEEHPP
jgi:TPR repeat protein